MSNLIPDLREMSNAVATVDANPAAIQPALASRDVGPEALNAGGIGLRARRASRQEAPQPPSSLNIPVGTDFASFIQRQRGDGSPAPTPEETELEGETLFLNFINEEVAKEVSLPEEFPRAVTAVTPSTGGAAATPGPNYVRLGGQLRECADDFAQSNERRRVRAQANKVDLANMTQGDFIQMLIGLFNDGDGGRNITFERIVVLFFFIRDLAVRAIKDGINKRLLDFMKWSVSFIRGHVCTWVQEHGGWEAVLKSVFNKKLLLKTGLVVMAVAATLAITGVIIYWHKNN